MTPAETVARVTWTHRFDGGGPGRDASCLGDRCGWSHPWDRPTHEMLREHNAHVAEEAVAALGLREERPSVSCGYCTGEGLCCRKHRRYVTDWQEVGE